jgi:hypothetical protein
MEPNTPTLLQEVTGIDHKSNTVRFGVYKKHSVIVTTKVQVSDRRSKLFSLGVVGIIFMIAWIIRGMLELYDTIVKEEELSIYHRAYWVPLFLYYLLLDVIPLGLLLGAFTIYLMTEKHSSSNTESTD